jgi:hypothetical protein
MSNFQSSAPAAQANEAAGLVQVETTKPWRSGLPDESVDTGSPDPEAVRLATSQAIDQANASLEAVSKYAKQQPGKALIAALLVGFVLGRLM